MTVYFVGDIQGCYSELDALLSKIAFSNHHDQLYVAGDLVARGPDSLATLRLIKSLKSSAKIVLGNHDLHLLSVFHGLKKEKKQDSTPIPKHSTQQKTCLSNYTHTLKSFLTPPPSS